MPVASPATVLAFPFPAEAELPALGNGEIHVWLALPQPNDRQLHQCASMLSNDELQRMARFHFEEHRDDFLFARSMSRILISAYLRTRPEHVKFLYSEQGKPCLAPPFAEADLQFNLSHTKGAVLLAICEGRSIGADIEQVREDFDPNEIAAKFFSTKERHSLMSLAEGARREAFFRCWTRKEALLKAKGGGLSLPLDLFDVSIDADESVVTIITRPDPKEAEQWQIMPVPVPAGYAAAVALGSFRPKTGEPATLASK